jgi:tetratricopeptide (TPR) repeat protein
VDADPDYQPARRGLAELLRQRGHNQFELGRYAAARDIYAAAVQLTPDDAELLASIGYAELLLKNEAAARGHFEAALAQGTSEAYTEVFDRWAWNGNLNEARQVVARAEAMPVPMPHFYVNAASTVFAEMHPPAFEPFAAGPQKRMPAAIDSWEGLGKTLVEKAMATAGNRQDVYVHIITEIGPLRPELALPAAEKAAALMPDEPETWLSLALMQGITDRRREAKETLRRASLLTRKRGDMRLLSEIEELRRALDDPLFSMAAQLWPALDERDFEDL